MTRHVRGWCMSSELGWSSELATQERMARHVRGWCRDGPFAMPGACPLSLSPPCVCECFALGGVCVRGAGAAVRYRPWPQPFWPRVQCQVGSRAGTAPACAIAAPEVEPDLAFIPAERGVPQDIQDLFRHEAWARAMGVGRWFCCRRRRLARTLERWARLYRHLRRLRRLQRVFAFAGHHLAATYPRSLLRRLRAVW